MATGPFGVAQAYLPARKQRRCALHTTVSAVQTVGHRETWSADHVYVGMPGNAARAFGILAAEGQFGKPWACMNDPRGWTVAYNEYLVGRLSDDRKFQQAVRALHGRTLLCWCAAKGAERCHAVLLAEYVELLFHAACTTCGQTGHESEDHGEVPWLSATYG